jgi:hypothetical protein
MTAAPSSFDSITIPVSTPAGFDSIYPSIHPDANISQDEYEQSIANINRIYVSQKSLDGVIIPCVLDVCMGFVWIVLCMVPEDFFFRMLLLFGGLGTVFISLICYWYQYSVEKTEYENRLQEAIAKESAKYSMRSPVCCTWRRVIETHQSTLPGGRSYSWTTDHVSHFASPDRLIAKSDLIKPFETPLQFDRIS